MYGTSFKAVQDVLSASKNVILDIDVQGVKQLKSSDKLANILYIFVCPPSLQELEKRLRARGTEDAESLEKRLDAAKGEWVWGHETGNVDAVVLNDDLETAYVDLVKALGI
jgi:guanylate kinase